MPIVSVVVSIYNTMQWLTDCVESIRNQTLRDIEIILVDDGSTDYSGVICDAYADLDGRIRVIHQENQGDSAAKNAGMDIAMGKYLMFCDSDDYVAPEWCACAVELAEAHPDALVSLTFADVNICGVHCDLYSETEGYSVFRHGELFKFLKTNGAWSVSNKIFERRYLLQYDLKFDVNVSYGEDFLFTTKYLKSKNYVVLRNISALCYYRHWTTESLAKKFLGKKLFEFSRQMEDIFLELLCKEEYPDFYLWFFWTKGMRSLTSILDSRNHESLERQKADCQEIVASPEFRRWSAFAIAEDTKNPMLEALRSGDFDRAYEPFVQWMEERMKPGEG